LLDPELKSKVGVLGRQAGDSIYTGMAPYGTPPTEPFKAKPLPADAPAPWRPKPAGYPTEPERRAGGGSSIGEEYTGEPAAVTPAIPERTVAQPGYTNYAPGIDYKAEPETAATRAGDVTARRGLEERSTARMGELRKEVEGGMPARQTLAEKEAAGGGGEFDFGSYKSALASIGGKPGLKTRMAILSHMMGEHEKKTEGIQKMKELEKTYGEGSAHMIAAKSEARFREIQGQNALNLAPHEIAKTIEDTAHVRAQTEAIPFDIAYKRSMAEYHQSLIESKEFANESAYLKILAEKIEKGLPGDPETVKAQKEFDQVVESKRGQMMVERFERQNPMYKGKVKWENGKLTEIK
jgi:hypothetical protein